MTSAITMTLAIAVQYPYGRFREALESLSKIRPLQRQEAIIFLTDSRWTYPDNHYEDNGMKLYDIDNSTVLAYSGKVNIFSISTTPHVDRITCTCGIDGILDRIIRCA